MEAATIRHIEEISRSSFFNHSFELHAKYELSPLFQESDGNVVILSGISPASFFSNPLAYTELDWRGFRAFIASRINYLQQLKTLGENWASGKSLPPSEGSVERGIELLKHIEQWYNTLESYNPVFGIPAIIMGPIPSGGLSFEISPQTGIKIYINIFNDGQIDMELDSNGYFIDIPVTGETFKEAIAETLSQYAERRRYSRWGDPISVC